MACTTSSCQFDGEADVCPDIGTCPKIVHFESKMSLEQNSVISEQQKRHQRQAKYTESSQNFKVNAWSQCCRMRLGHTRIA